MESVFELVLLVVNLVNMYLARKNASSARWGIIARIATYAARDTYAAAPKSWQEIAVTAMKALVERAKAEPGIGGLSAKELELVKPVVVAEAKRLAGVTNGVHVGGSP